jgi:hypothetical protein
VEASIASQVPYFDVAILVTTDELIPVIMTEGDTIDTSLAIKGSRIVGISQVLYGKNR